MKHNKNCELGDNRNDCPACKEVSYIQGPNMKKSVEKKPSTTKRRKVRVQADFWVTVTGGATDFAIRHEVRDNCFTNAFYSVGMFGPGENNSGTIDWSVDDCGMKVRVKRGRR